MVRTSDGQMHDSARAARKYCDDNMGNIITKHAAALVHVDKYTKLIDYIIDNLDDFSLARQWRDEAKQTVIPSHTHSKIP